MNTFCTLQSTPDIPITSNKYTEAEGSRCILTSPVISPSSPEFGTIWTDEMSVYVSCSLLLTTQDSQKAAGFPVWQELCFPGMRSEAALPVSNTE